MCDVRAGGDRGLSAGRTSVVLSLVAALLAIGTAVVDVTGMGWSDEFALTVCVQSVLAGATLGASYVWDSRPASARLALAPIAVSSGAFWIVWWPPRSSGAAAVVVLGFVAVADTAMDRWRGFDRTAGRSSASRRARCDAVRGPFDHDGMPSWIGRYLHKVAALHTGFDLS